METILGVIMLLLVLAAMSLFAFKAPYGKKSLGALSGAACATFLGEAFLRYAVGEVFNIEYIANIGETMGGLGGLAVGALVPLSFGISPVFSVIMGVTLVNFNLLPAFIASYVLSFIIVQIEKKVPEGIDLIVVVLIAPTAGYFIADMIEPVVTGILNVIGQTILVAVEGNQYIMGAILGAIITIVGMTPLSSMVLTALIGLTGVPMGIGAMGCYGCSILNAVFFQKMKFGSNSTALSVAIEPLTQIDIISSNPIPIYTTNAVAGAINGIITTYFALQIPVTGMATPWAGLLVILGSNPMQRALIAVAIITIVSLLVGFIGSYIFKDFKKITVDDIRGTGKAETAN